MSLGSGLRFWGADGLGGEGLGCWEWEAGGLRGLGDSGLGSE